MLRTLLHGFERPNCGPLGLGVSSGMSPISCVRSGSRSDHFTEGITAQYAPQRVSWEREQREKAMRELIAQEEKEKKQ